MADRDPAEPDRRGGELRFPRPRAVRRPVHPRRPRDQGSGRRRQVRQAAGVPADRDGGVLHGRVDRGAARRPGRRRGRGGLGERPGALVLPRHRADAAGALGGGTPVRAAGDQAVPQDQGELGPLGSGARAAGRGGRPDRADAAADRARRPGFCSFPSTTRSSSTRPRTTRRSCGSSPGSGTQRRQRTRRWWTASAAGSSRPSSRPGRPSPLPSARPASRGRPGRAGHQLAGSGIPSV